MSESTQQSSVLDVGAEQLGKLYARALIGAATKEGVAEEVLSQLSDVVDEGLSKNASLKAALASPRVSEAEKNAVIDRLFAGQAHSVLIRTMKVMNAHGRLGYLGAVRDAAAEIYDEQLGRVVAEVRTAVPLPPSLRDEVAGQIGRSLGKQVRLRETIDAGLIGGTVIRVGDTVFDSSVAGRLNKLGRAVREGFAHQLMERAAAFVSEDAGESEEEAATS